MTNRVYHKLRPDPCDTTSISCPFYNVFADPSRWRGKRRRVRNGRSSNYKAGRIQLPPAGSQHETESSLDGRRVLSMTRIWRYRMARGQRRTGWLDSRHTFGIAERWTPLSRRSKPAISIGGRKVEVGFARRSEAVGPAGTWPGRSHNHGGVCCRFAAVCIRSIP